MNLEQVCRWRKTAGWVAALFFFLVFTSLFDGCVAKFREPINVFDLLPGGSAKVDGPLEAKLKDISELTYAASSDLVTLSFDATQTGFWLGGNMWIGTVSVGSGIQPGEYDLKVFLKSDASQKPLSVFRIKTYKNYEDLRQSFKSFIKRYLDVAPWWAAIFFFVLAGATLGAVFLLSQKIEYLLAQQGKAEVYLVRKTETSYDIGFALGTRHGVGPGSKLSLYDDGGRPVGTAVVRESRATDSLAAVDADVPVRQGYVVAKEASDTK